MWLDALKLLNFQVEQKRKNKHFNTLSIFYYEKLSQWKVSNGREYFEVSSLTGEKYYESKIANNLFYGLRTEFAAHPYFEPKNGLGLRNYRFLTYPMRVVYYAIGLYLLRVGGEFIKYIGRREEICSYYGGNLKYTSELTLSHNSVYYRKHYQKFCKEIENETENNLDNKVFLRFDATSYFDSISIPILLNYLNTYTAESKKQELKYDSATIEQIRFFFTFLSSNHLGVPQTDNGIISDFIGHLYLLFGDLLIDDLLKTNNQFIERHKIIRYVDDIYLLIVFKDGVSISKRESLVSNLGEKIADVLNKELQIHLNSKTGYYRLNREAEIEELIGNLKNVSPNLPIPNDDDGRTPQQRADNIFIELEVLKSSELNTSFQYSRNSDPSRLIDQEVLKDVYSNTVDTILSKNENKERLLEIFQGFNFDLVRANPSAIICIMMRNGLDEITDKFHEYLQYQSSLTTNDISLILKFLAQKSFQDTALLKRLMQDEYMKVIILTFNKPFLPKQPGYFDLTNGVIKQITNIESVIAQIRERNMSEKMNSYSKALNHLLNEIHAICFELHRKLPGGTIKKISQYDVNDVEKFLHLKQTPNEIIVQIRKLFDRRNVNLVSHAGSDNTISWDVTGREYWHFHEYVGKCLKYVLKK